MELRTLWTLTVFLCVTLTSSTGILSERELRCSRQDLNCSASHSNCLDHGWLRAHQYTPSGPEELQLRVDTRRDDGGLLQPVLEASWKIKDDGSIRYLKATELQVLTMSTNQNTCVRYSLKGVLPMRSPSGEKWSFSSDVLVLDPGKEYRVSVFNIPRPELGHSHYDVSRRVQVPGCHDPKMKLTQFCVERGSLWQPNITVALTDSHSALTVNFSPDQRCDTYRVIVRCGQDSESVVLQKTAQTTLNTSFGLSQWPRSCCQFDAQINPFFPQCNNDCPRRRVTRNICPDVSAEPPKPSYPLVAVGLAFTCVVMVILTYFLCRNRKKSPYPPDQKVQDQQEVRTQLQQPPKVLVIYSQDHHLYRDVVLKLCAFLQAKCGTKVLVDLLDSASVSMVGRVRWLEWQRRQLQNPSDKILVLCSRGVQAKWRAMCGQGRVMLREDVLSPTDDMLTPFLNLFLPDLHRAAGLGKYLVAYFDDIGSEGDVPSVFDITVKFSLMNHFEELFFRILDLEKYEPGQVVHIEGISGGEYSSCPSGSALKNAIETFKVFQLENPDWFEKECVLSEDEVRSDAEPLLEQMQIPPVLEWTLPIRDGPPVYVNDLDYNQNLDRVRILTPQLNPENQLSVAELLPVLHPGPSGPVPVLADYLMYPHGPGPGPESFSIAEPVLNIQPGPLQNWIQLNEELEAQIPAEDDEDTPLVPRPASDALLDSMDSRPPEPSSEPVEMEEDLEMHQTGQNSESDQGYISRISSQHDVLRDNPLETLARIQEELFQRTMGYSDLVPEEELGGLMRPGPEPGPGLMSPGV